MKEDTSQYSDLARHIVETQAGTLGLPRSIKITDKGILYLQSAGSKDSVNDLWFIKVDKKNIHTPYLLVDSHSVDNTNLPEEELRRRERLRERGGGIVSYTTSEKGDLACFSWGGEVAVVQVKKGGKLKTLDTPGAMVQPTISPDGKWVAGVIDRSLWIISVKDSSSRAIAFEDNNHIKWGLPDFVASEEFDRHQGFWWAPDSKKLCVARVDDRNVKKLWISSPISPKNKPTEFSYPLAGTTNALVSLHCIDLHGNIHDLPISVGNQNNDPHSDNEYLTSVQWSSDDTIIACILNRKQDQMITYQLTADGKNKESIWIEESDAWVEICNNLPHVFTNNNKTHIIRTANENNVRRLYLDHELYGKIPRSDDWTTTSLSAITVDDGNLTIWANGIPTSKPWLSEGRILKDDKVVRLPGQIQGGEVSGRPIGIWKDTSLLGIQEYKIISDSGEELGSIPVNAEEIPDFGVETIGPMLSPAGNRFVIVFPKGQLESDSPLPVLVSSYGGPKNRVVVNERSRLYQLCLFAGQGMTTIAIDGPGAVGVGLKDEAAIEKNLQATLDAQVEALQFAASEYPQLFDMQRVAIRGWSYGGYLSARAALQRPDVFHAAIAGAPVTDWLLYDTGYTERYLGNPVLDPGAYTRENLTQLVSQIHSEDWNTKLLIMHGLEDDNVFIAHSLKLSNTMLENGLEHEMIPLSGVTHFAKSTDQMTNLFNFELDFLQRSLKME